VIKTNLNAVEVYVESFDGDKSPRSSAHACWRDVEADVNRHLKVILLLTHKHVVMCREVETLVRINTVRRHDTVEHMFIKTICLLNIYQTFSLSNIYQTFFPIYQTFSSFVHDCSPSLPSIYINRGTFFHWDFEITR